MRNDEYDAYRKSLPAEVECVACGYPKNLSVKRAWIAEYSAARGEKVHAQCDDDVKLFIRAGDDTVKLREPTVDEIKEMLHVMWLLLDKYPMVGISPREGNNYAGPGAMPLLKECTRSMRFYAFRNTDLLSIESDRLSEMADFDTILQFLRRGQKNAVLYYWAQNQPTTQHPGGCAAYRTHATHDAVARQLAELHPGLVSLRQKQNKGGGEFGTRTEVVVQWRKAYEIGHDSNRG